MNDDQAPSTDLEAAVKRFVDREYQPIKLANEVYFVVPASEIRLLRWAIDPKRPTPSPYVSLYPGMKGGYPTLNRTRLTVDAVADFVWAGYMEDQIQRHGWDITREEILVCCWYLGQWGSRTWRKRWRAWAQEAYGPLTHGEPCPWPPSAGLEDDES